MVLCIAPVVAIVRNIAWIDISVQVHENFSAFRVPEIPLIQARDRQHVILEIQEMTT